MRYFMIDRVTYLAANRRISAIKNVALSEDVFADHFMGNPVMPGALQIEALAQAGTILLEISGGLKVKALLVMIQVAKFRELVRPGDQLIVDSSIEFQDDRVARLKGEIRVGEKLVTNSVLTFSLEPFHKFYDPRLRPFADMLYSRLLDGATLVDVAPFGEV